MDTKQEGKIVYALVDQGVPPAAIKAVINTLRERDDEDFVFRHGKKDKWDQMPVQLGSMENAEDILQEFAKKMKPNEHMEFSERVELMWRLLADDKTRLAHVLKILWQQDMITGTCMCPSCEANRIANSVGLDIKSYNLDDLEKVKDELPYEVYEMLKRIRDDREMGDFLDNAFDDDSE